MDNTLKKQVITIKMMEGIESQLQEPSKDSEMRVVTQEPQIQTNNYFSEDTEAGNLQKKQKIQKKDTLNNFGQETTESQDHQMMESDYTPIQRDKTEFSEEANLAENRKKGISTSVINPYSATKSFSQALKDAESRKNQNKQDNINSTSLLIKFNIRGFHGEKAFTSDVNLYRMILSVIFNKARKHSEDILLHPWDDELPPIRHYEDIDDMVNEDTKHSYLYAPNVRRGAAVFKREIKDGTNSSFAIRLSNVNQEPIDERFVQEWNRTSEGVNNWDTQRLLKEAGKEFEITIMEIEMRPIQQKEMAEVGYIYGSINGQDMKEIIEGMQKDFDGLLSYPVTLGTRWTQPDLGPELSELWKEAMKHEGKERSLRTPMIQVIYANQEDVTKLRDISAILQDNYGEHEKIETTTGNDYELPKLPDGSRGIFIRAYRLTRSNKEKENTVTMFKYHIQMKATCSKWIRTNIVDPEKIVQFKGEVFSLREYMLSRRIAPGVFYYHQMITRKDIMGRKVTYLICNNAYGQSSTQKYQELVDQLLDDDEDAEDAFEDVSIGAVSAFSKDSLTHKQPSELSTDRYSVTLSKMIAIERKRIDNVYIEGIQIKEISLPEKTNLFQVRPRRNIRIDKDENHEDVEGEISTVDTSLKQGERNNNEQEKEQEWQTILNKKDKAAKGKEKTVSFTITNNGNDNHNDISHNIFHVGRNEELDPLPRMDLRSRRNTDNVRDRVRGRGGRGSFSIRQTSEALQRLNTQDDDSGTGGSNPQCNRE